MQILPKGSSKHCPDPRSEPRADDFSKNLSSSYWKAKIPSKAKEDEERRAELCHKRGEDALRFNAVLGMKERFFNGTHNRNFNKERQFSLNRIEEDFPDIRRQIKERYWNVFTISPDRYCPTLVHELYASYGAAQKHQKAISPLRSRPLLKKVKVRGVEVDCNAKAINRAYFDDGDADATNYLAKLENPENHYTLNASLIAAGTPSWVSDRSHIYKSDLNIQAKQWLGFVCSKLTPSKNDNEVSLGRVILVACIMTGLHINVGDIIVMEIRDRARQAYTSLPFLVLITSICRDTSVQEIERIDEYVWVNHVLNITKIQDEMSPKLKKRKRS
ncbi:hypothetical protein HAX54_041456 [Datura stramonium]|uniref:Putative plant transposon protein domain-containing protein n=1 Tax=Datura stramonium TaxID=4076 RepID=A0ABS8SKZ9_DATST|nr:hypothetical protein [Datura stramonium]